MKKSHFIKQAIKDAVPAGFDAVAVAESFAGTPLQNDHPAIDVLKSISERRAVQELEAEPESTPIVGTFDGDAKPDFGSGKGGGGGKGGGKNKPVEEPSDPEPAPAPVPDTTPTPTPAPAADFVSGLDTPGGFNIEIMYGGTWSASQKIALASAAEQISDLILGDLPDYNGIDDIRINANMVTIDGAGGTWGKGGIDALRPDSKLPFAGHITIDQADAPTAESYGLFEDLVFHEMLHALGFGTTWSTLGLVDDFNGDLRFNGDKATEIYNSQYADMAANDPLSTYGVPLETSGGSGSVGKHWDESKFNNDIMSTQLDWNNTISDLSVAALEDMGYQTILSDSFDFV